MTNKFVAKIKGKIVESNVRHYVGLPPELTSGKDTRQQLGTPVLLLIEDTHEGVFLFRFSSEGDEVGDTWHQTIDEAKAQAHFEFGDHISSWKVVPEDIQDVFAYGLKTLDD